MTSHKHNLGAKRTFLKWRPPKSVFFSEANFSGIASTSEAETSVSGSAECLLPKKESFLE